jgi:hypothetical protein
VHRFPDTIGASRQANNYRSSVDWVAWHADYESDTPLRRRLEIVQRHIGTFLADFEPSPVRVISMCSGEARDLLGAVAVGNRRDIVGRLVELNTELAATARRNAHTLGLHELDVVTGDAGHSHAYSGALPADLVLACGVFGNISDTDVERTVRAMPMLTAPGATVIWTRHRRKPDLTPSIRRWFRGAGFEEIAFQPVPGSSGSVGVARYTSATKPLVDRQLFTFTRTA